MEVKTVLEVACHYSEAAYEGAVNFDEWYFDKKSGAEAGLIVTSAGIQVLAFKGTQGIKDLVIDAKAIPPFKYQGFWIHRGFRKQHKKLWPQLCLARNLPTIITGHSLGGALAEITAALLTDVPALSLVTFGKPNVFARWSDRPLYNLKHQISVVSGSDLITRVPRYFYRPSRSQTQLYFGNDGKDIINPSREYKKSDWKLFDAIGDHSMALYRKRLNRYLEAK